MASVRSEGSVIKGMHGLSCARLAATMRILTLEHLVYRAKAKNACRIGNFGVMNDWPTGADV
jgi:hypothetical protein